MNNTNQSNVPFNRIRRIAARITLTLLAIFVLLAVGGFTFERVAQAHDAERYPAPGQMVDVGGHSLHFYVTGEANGNPTVILEAGNGGFSSQWVRVQEALSRHTQVVSYDRSGLGWSDDDDQPRDLIENARQLHTGLQALGIEPPYILVGHSLGGVFNRGYVAEYPDEVIGMVFVDSAHPNQLERASEEIVTMTRQHQKLLTTLSNFAHFGVFRIAHPLASTVAALPEPQRAETLAIAATARYLAMSPGELVMWDRTPEYLDGHDDLGEMPLIVLTASEQLVSEELPEGFGEFWYALHEDMVTLSTNSEHRIIEGADHFTIIMAEAYAQQVADAILDVIDEAAR